MADTENNVETPAVEESAKPEETQAEEKEQSQAEEPKAEEIPAENPEPTDGEAPAAETEPAETAEPSPPEDGQVPAEVEQPAEADPAVTEDTPAADATPAAETAEADEKPKEEGDGEDKVEPEGDAAVQQETSEENAATEEGEQQPAEGVKEGEEGEQDKPADESAVKDDETTEDKVEAGSPIPQSDAFTEGEKAEDGTGVETVGEKLSREGSPVPATATDDEDRPKSPPRAETPDKAAGEVEIAVQEMEQAAVEFVDEPIEESPEPMYDRNALTERYHELVGQREQIQQQNLQLQHKLAEFFRRKKSDDAKQEVDKNVPDQEQRYLKYISNLEELRRQDLDLRDDYFRQIEDLKSRSWEKSSKVNDERDKFMEFKKQVALNSLNTRTGKPLQPRDIELALINENKKEQEVVNVRLENIKLKNKLKKKELQIKSKEELAEGLHMIDFEQLKIENQTYNEKIEERNEELLKLRKKITSTVQVLTHLKEKLQFVQAENHIQKGQLREVEVTVATKRDILSRTKQARDALRIDNQKLRQNCGLLGNEPLLRDFEERKDDGDGLREKLDRLKMHHAGLTLDTSSIRRKIEQARQGGT